MTNRFKIALGAALLTLSLPALAQDGLPPPGEGERQFGFEFELAGQGSRVVNFEKMPFKNYRNLMIEIRGLVTWVDGIEWLAKVFTERLTTMEFGPWEHPTTRSRPGSARCRASSSATCATCATSRAKS